MTPSGNQLKILNIIIIFKNLVRRTLHSIILCV